MFQFRSVEERSRQRRAQAREEVSTGGVDAMPTGNLMADLARALASRRRGQFTAKFKYEHSLFE